MSRNSETLTRKNNKLEAFLKKNLDADTFEKLRTYDSCIVCSEKEDKAFKFVVITDEWIYLTENPPKTVYETVHFSDVVSVELLNEFPEFLNGEQRQNTQHIVVKYLTLEPKKGHKSSRKNQDGGGPKSHRSDPSLHGVSPSGRRPSSSRALSARNSIGLDRLGMYSARQLSDPARRQSLGNGTLSSRSLQDNKRVQFRRDSPFGSHLTVPEQQRHDVTLNAASGSGSGQNSPHRTKKGKVRTKSLEPTTFKRALDGMDHDSGSGGGGSDAMYDFNNSNKTVRHLATPKDRTSKGDRRDSAKLRKSKLDNVWENSLAKESEEEDDEVGNVTLEVPSINIPPLDLKSCSITDGDEDRKTYRDATVRTVEEVNTSRSGAACCCAGAGAAAAAAAAAGKNKRMELSFTTIISNSITPRSTMGSEESTMYLGAASAITQGKREASLHLYIMHLNSPVLNLTRCAWNNYLIRGTLEEDPQYLFRRDAFNSGKPKGTSGAAKYEKLEQLFCQLRNELLAPHNRMEDTFNLLSELKSAAERTFAIKKLFWKTSELFMFLMHTLKSYLPRSPLCDGLTDKDAKELRADQFELVILIIETLSVMFRETETLASRLPALTANKGQMTRELLLLLLCVPEIPQRYMPPPPPLPSHSNSHLRRQPPAPTHRYTDEELSALLDELTNASTHLLFELILVTSQANWGAAGGGSDNFFNTSWLVTQLDNMPHFESFIERLVRSALSMISPSVGCSTSTSSSFGSGFGSEDELRPHQALLLYVQFFTLHRLMDDRATVTRLIRKHFHVDFKYYIQPPVILQKLPAHYPLYAATLCLIEDVVSDVLKSKVRLHTNSNI